MEPILFVVILYDRMMLYSLDSDIRKKKNVCTLYYGSFSQQLLVEAFY